MRRRPFRLVIEVNNPDGPGAIAFAPAPASAPTPASALAPTPVAAALSDSKPDLAAVWPMLVDAREKLIDAMGNGSGTKVTDTNNWIGGALAVAAVLTGNSAEALRDRLAAEVPMPERKSPYEAMGEFRHVERERPKPHPGAQRPVDLSELSAEERAELGIVLPGEDSE